jgi:tetratricopeptide (TPR) repeat protein
MKCTKTFSYLCVMRKCFYFIILPLALLFSCKDETKKEAATPKFASVGDPVIDQLTIAIDKDPLNHKLRYERALKLYDKGMLDECIEDMRVAITVDSVNADYYHLVADAFLDNNLSSKALQSMEKVTKLYPNRIPSLLKYAEFQHILRQSQAAILTCNEIIRQDPQNAEAYFMLGSILKDMNEVERAANSFQTATEMDANLTDAWIALGNIYADKKDNKAIQYYQNAIDVDSSNSTAKHSLAFYYQEINQVDKALMIYDEIIVSDPSYKDAYFNSGVLLLGKNQQDKALEKFNILVGIDPQDWNAYYYKAMINYQKGNIKAALADVKNSIKLNPKNELALKLLKDCEKKSTQSTQ